jgi:HAMP domain-containing protein
LPPPREAPSGWRGAGRRAGLDSVVTQIATTNLEEAQRLTKELPPNTLSGASSVIAGALVKQSPESALEWAATLPDGTTKASAYAGIARDHPGEPVAKTAGSMAALTLLELGKPQEALAQADRFLVDYADGTAVAADSAVADVRAIRAEALLASGDAAAAAAAYRDLVARAAGTNATPPAQLARWRLRQGVALVAARQWAAAHDALAAAWAGLEGDPAAEAAAFNRMHDAYHEHLGIIQKAVPMLNAEREAAEAVSDRIQVLGISAMIALGALMMLIIGGGVFILRRRIVRPIEGITRYMGDLAEGHYEQPVPFMGRSDELGDMAKSVATFR